MKPRKGVSKRRWKARARMGKWLPYTIVFAIDRDPAPLSERWSSHPTDPDFWRLKTPPEVTSGGLSKPPEVAEVAL